MKKLLTIILSLNLMITPVVLADSTKDAKVKNQVIALVTSSIGTNILFMCSLAGMQPSLYAFMAGSATHVITEIAAGKAIKDLHEKNLTEIANLKQELSKGGEVQKIILEKNLSDEKEKLKFAERRISWLKVVNLAYSLAAGLAAVEVWRSLPTPVGLNIPSAAACTPNPALPTVTGLAITAAYTYQNVKAGGALSSLMYLLMPIHSSLVPVMYQNGYLRVATFLAAKIFTKQVINDLNEVKGKLESNIAQLEMLQASFNQNTLADGGVAETAGAGAGDGSTGGTINPSSGGNYALNKLPKVTPITPKECLTNNGGLTVSSAGCTNIYKLGKPKWDLSFNTSSLKDYTNSTVEVANALGEGNFERADVLAGQLNSNAARIEKFKDEAFKKMKDSLVASGEKFDLDAEVKKQYDKMSSEFDKASSKGAGDLAAAPTISKPEIVVKNKTSDNETNKEIKSSQIDAGALDLNFSESAGNEVDPSSESNLANLSENLNEFQSSEGDIAKESDVSIFRQVSNRYLLNYTKIFNRKEIAPPLKESDQAP